MDLVGGGGGWTDPPVQVVEAVVTDTPRGETEVAVDGERVAAAEQVGNGGDDGDQPRYADDTTGTGLGRKSPGAQRQDDRHESRHETRPRQSWFSIGYYSRTCEVVMSNIIQNGSTSHGTVYT